MKSSTRYHHTHTHIHTSQHPELVKIKRMATTNVDKDPEQVLTSYTVGGTI